MTAELKIEITELVNKSLDEAERIWKRVGHEIIEAKQANFSGSEVRAHEIESPIPGHASVDSMVPVVDDFIALVLDIRESSVHLKKAISAKASMLERVFYETSAVLPACSRVIRKNNGKVTEFLGDGLLAFFHSPKNKRESACYQCHDASTGCMEVIKQVVNPMLFERYELPALKMGIGMAFSQSIVTVTGDGETLKPTAFGHCVFDATKLSKGENQIFVADSLERIWPVAESGKKGKVRFTKTAMKEPGAYIMTDIE